jgi:dienelactone hydrolase
MVVQGKNDPRVNVRESNQIVAAVRDNGKPVEYLVAPDEGHGFARPINNLAMVAAMEEFFAKYLGGRYQKEMPTDVEAKLKEITVDPKTVSGDVKLNGALAAPAK